MREIEIRAVTVVAGAAAGAAAAALGCGNADGWAVGGADGDGDGDGLTEAVVSTRAVDASLVGDRLTTVAAMASRTTTQTDVRIRRPRLTPPSSPAGEGMSIEQSEGDAHGSC